MATPSVSSDVSGIVDAAAADIRDLRFLVAGWLAVEHCVLFASADIYGTVRARGPPCPPSVTATSSLGSTRASFASIAPSRKPGVEGGRRDGQPGCLGADGAPSTPPHGPSTSHVRWASKSCSTAPAATSSDHPPAATTSPLCPRQAVGRGCRRRLPPRPRPFHQLHATPRLPHAFGDRRRWPHHRLQGHLRDRRRSRGEPCTNSRRPLSTSRVRQPSRIRYCPSPRYRRDRLPHSPALSSERHRDFPALIYGASFASIGKLGTGLRRRTAR